MIPALLLLCELAFFALLLWTIRRASKSGEETNLGFFAFRASLTDTSTVKEDKKKGSANA